MNPDFAGLNDEALAYVLRQYELRIASLRYATGDAAQALRREFIQKRDAALAEQERRRV